MYLENRQELLKVNISNKNDVIDRLGRPHSKSLTNDDTWIYIERTKSKGKIYTLGRNVLINNNVLVVSFDKYGIINEKLFYDKDNMKDYKFTKAETDNEVRRGSFVQSFLQSLRQKMNVNSGKKNQCDITANKRSATMFVIFIIGFTAGPAVSL